MPLPHIGRRESPQLDACPWRLAATWRRRALAWLTWVGLGASAAAVAWPGVAAAAPWQASPAGGVGSVRVLIAPLGSLVALVDRLAGEHASPAATLPVPAGPSWHVVGAEIQAPVRALLISIKGRVEFQTAEIVLDDGAIERVDLAGAARGRGVYALRDWPEARDVLGVRLSARALADDAAIGFLLVR